MRRGILPCEVLLRGLSALRTRVLFASLLACSLTGGVYAQQGGRILDVAMNGSERVCRGGMQAMPEPDAIPLARYSSRDVNRRYLTARDWQLSDGLLLRVSRYAPPDKPPLYFAAVYSSPEEGRPFIRLVRGDRCTLRGGERIEYATSDDAPSPARLVYLDRSLKPRAPPVPLNPGIPDSPHAKTGCLPVAVLDNGVNYLLPSILERLARDNSDDLLGYDFWEHDSLPFDQGIPEGDLDPRVSAFEPPTHGTSVASAFANLAPEDLCLAPYRYAPQRPNRDIEDMIARIADDGVRIVVFTSGRQVPWPEFPATLAAHPDMLFISAAGNSGLDLRQRAVFPMIYTADNYLVVGATDKSGSIWRMSNRGDGIVEVAVPAVGLEGLDWSGAPKKLVGTSFAAPRVAVLAGLMAQKEPELDGAALKSALLELFRSEGQSNGDTLTLSEDQLQTAVRKLAD